MQALTTLRTVVATVLDEVEDRVHNLVGAARFSAKALVGGALNAITLTFNRGVDAACDFADSVVETAFALVDAVATLVLGEEPNPLEALLVNEADYNAGFADGRVGMVPAKKESE